MREVEHAERAEDDGQPAADQGQQRAQRQAVEGLGKQQRQRLAWYGGRPPQV